MLISKINLLRCQAQVLLLQCELKEYDAPWLKDSGAKVYRQGGRFASKDSSEGETEHEIPSISEEDLEAAIARYREKAKDVSLEEKDNVQKAMMHPEVIKLKDNISTFFHEFDKAAGAAFDKVTGAIDKKREPRYKSELEEMSLKLALEIAKEKPGMAALGALGAWVMWTGTGTSITGAYATTLGISGGLPGLAMAGLGAVDMGLGALEIYLGKMAWDKAAKELTAQRQKHVKYTKIEEKEIETLSGKIDEGIKELVSQINKQIAQSKLDN